MATPLAFITGSCGLIGSEVSLYFSRLGFRIAGLDNNQRAVFFGPAGDTSWALERLQASIPGYAHHSLDIRDRDAILLSQRCLAVLCYSSRHAAAGAIREAYITREKGL